MKAALALGGLIVLALSLYFAGHVIASGDPTPCPPHQTCQ